MPVAPTVRYGDQVMVESGAIIELIFAREGSGGTAPRQSTRPTIHTICSGCTLRKDRSPHASLPTIGSTMIQGRPKPHRRLQAGRSRKHVLKFADDFLSRHPYFGGANFSAADIMMLFPTNFAAGMNVVDLAAYPHVAAWKQKVESRPAYKKMLEVARPDGLIGSPMPLSKEPSPGSGQTG